MFYTPDIFKKELGYLTDEQCKHISRVANNIIEKQGTLAWGRALDDGTLHAFSTDKEKSDSHVAVVIGESEMGIFKPDASSSRRDMPGPLSGVSKDDFIKQQALELKTARGVINRREQKRPGSTK